MSPQGGLVADAKLQGHNRRHGQTREREVEDARAALWHVDVEARRHDRAVRSSTVHRYGDRAVRRPQERHLVAQPPDVDDGKLPEREPPPHRHDAVRDGSRYDARPVDDVREPQVLGGYDAGTAGPRTRRLDYRRRLVA